MSNEKNYCYRYPHPAVTVDCVVFGFDGTALKILLIERGIEPFKGMWALPGGFMNISETAEQAALRELREETGLSGVVLDQFRVYSDIDRDPRERVVTIAFMALVRREAVELIAGDDAANALWFDERYLPPMAFDHARIISEARSHLSEILRIRPVAFDLLNKTFSLGELQKVYEVINRTQYDRRNFQRKILQTGMLEETEAPSPRTAMPMTAEEPCMSSFAIPPDASRKKPKPPQGRPLQKLFSFNRKKKSSEQDTHSDGSTRDLFDY